MYSAKRTTSQNADFNSLIIELNNYLSGQYGEVQKQYSPHNKVEGIDTVIVIYDGEKAVGCGCFKPYDDVAVEIKRMYVSPENRNQGIGALIMQNLEQWATELGYKACVLETGDNQPEAVALYKKVGYVVTEKYGVYVNLDHSICMRKELTSAQS
jgi:putative acetyltransferase